VCDLALGTHWWNDAELTGHHQCWQYVKFHRISFTHAFHSMRACVRACFYREWYMDNAFIATKFKSNFTTLPTLFVLPWLYNLQIWFDLIKMTYRIEDGSHETIRTRLTRLTHEDGVDQHSNSDSNLFWKYISTGQDMWYINISIFAVKVKFVLLILLSCNFITLNCPQTTER